MNELMLQDRIISLRPALINADSLELGERYYRMFSGEAFGECLSDCYNPLGSALWSHFIRVQERAFRENSVLATYDVVRNEIEAIHGLGPAIADIIVNDKDIDPDNLIVIENGSGSREAVINKTLAQLRQLADAGGDVKLYSPWEKSEYFRDETQATVNEFMPELTVIPQNVDFTRDDPDLSVKGRPDIDVEGPRIIIENGTPRSNIHTTSPDDVPIERLRDIFDHNRKVCRTGGYLVLNCDGDQDGDRNELKYKDSAHAQVGQAYAHFGQRQGVLSENYEPLNLYYRPIWDGRRSILRHSLIEAIGQRFSVLRRDGKFHSVTLNENDGYNGLRNVFSHSIKWKPELMCEAAKAGFKPVMAEPMTPNDPQNYTYVFKAI